MLQISDALHEPLWLNANCQRHEATAIRQGPNVPVGARNSNQLVAFIFCTDDAVSFAYGHTYQNPDRYYYKEITLFEYMVQSHKCCILTGWCDSAWACLGCSPLLPGYHDELGARLWPSLDARLLLLHLDLSRPPAHYGDQV